MIERILAYPTIPPLIGYLLVASYFDVKYREMSDTILLAGYPFIAAGLAYYVLTTGVSLAELMYHLFVSGTVLSMLTVLIKIGVVGDGDFFLAVAMALGLPYVIWVDGYPVSSLLLAILLGEIYSLMEIVGSAVHNARRWRLFKQAVAGASTARVIYYFFGGRVLWGKEFKARKFYFPLVAPGQQRLVAKVGVEPLDPSAYGIPDDALVIATRGQPMAVHFLYGALVVGVLLYLSA